MPKPDLYKIDRAVCPENAGVNSQAVMQYIKDVDASGVNWHSFMFVKNGVVAAECFKYPYSPDKPHCMFSISKNITSIALGFAVFEKKLTLNDRVKDYFPEYCKADDTYINRLLVRHLASMCSGKAPNDLNRRTSHDWIQQFFDLKWEASPGKLFHYVNDNTFILSEIIRRATGETLVEYLMPRLFAPLGIEKPYWETDFNGTEAGGWGIYLKPEDFAKIFICVQQHGVYGGKRIIPQDWIEIAILNQTEIYKDPGPCKKPGYGFSFWRKEKDIYGGEGMYGQISIIDEANGLLILITGAEVIDTGKYWRIYNNYRNTIVCPENKNAVANSEVSAFLKSFKADDIMLSPRRSPLEAKLNNTTYKTKYLEIGKALGFDMSAVPAASIYMSKDTGGNISEFGFGFDKNTCTFNWKENGTLRSAVCGMDGDYRYSPTFMCGANYTFASYAVWKDIYTLEIHLRSLESIGKRVFVFDFSDFNNITAKPYSSPPVKDVLDSVSWVIYDKCTTKALKLAADKLFCKVATIIEPEIKLKQV